MFVYLSFFRIKLKIFQDLISKEVDVDSKKGSMFVPIILGSNKTTVSVATGDNEFYPLYMSIGNIKNNVCRVHKDALVLIGFLAITKGASSSSVIDFCRHQFTQLLLKKKIRRSFVALGGNYSIRPSRQSSDL